MNKGYDCIADKRGIQAEIYEETKHMSHEERRAWTQSQLEKSSLRDWWAQVKSVEEIHSGDPSAGARNDARVRRSTVAPQRRVNQRPWRVAGTSRAPWPQILRPSSHT